MTGRLHKLTGPQITADHEQRIRELERRLRAKQTSLPRRRVGGDAAWVLYEDVVGVSALNNNSTRAPYDTLVEEEGDHGVSVSGAPSPGVVTLEPGIYTVSAGVTFVTNATGSREIHITGTVSLASITLPPKTTVPAISGESHHLSIAASVVSTSGADQLWIFGRQTSGGALTMVGGFLSIVRH